MNGLSLQRVLAIAHKEFSHLRRDRLTGGMVAGMVGLVLAAPAWAIAADVHREFRAARTADEPAP